MQFSKDGICTIAWFQVEHEYRWTPSASVAAGRPRQDSVAVVQAQEFEGQDESHRDFTTELSDEQSADGAGGNT